MVELAAPPTPDAGPAAPGGPPLRRVAAVVLPGASPFELGVACEVFGLDRTAEGLPGFDFLVATEHPGTVPTYAGFGIDVRHGLDALSGVDLVMLCPTQWLDGVPSAPLAAALHAAVDAGTRVMSMCSASFILARAGLLDGHQATTHWFHAEAFRAEFPAVDLVPDVLYVEDGPISTSAGTAAAIDLCLALVRRSHGPAAAGGIARRMVVPPHRDGGQAQYVRTPVRVSTADTLAELLEWAAEHLDEDLSVTRLARRAGTSERTLARRFRDETGTTPHHWVTEQRLALAEELLERGAASVEEVAQRCGFGSAATLRHHFSRRRATTPTAYRRTFGEVPR